MREREKLAYLLSDTVAQEHLFVFLIHRWLSEHKLRKREFTECQWDSPFFYSFALKGGSLKKNCKTA